MRADDNVESGEWDVKAAKKKQGQPPPARGVPGVFRECEPTHRLRMPARLTPLPEPARAGLHR